MLKLQGGVNIQALMGGGMGIGRPPSMGLGLGLGSMAEGGEEGGEGGGSPRSSFSGRASVGGRLGRGSGIASGMDADRLSALALGEGGGGSGGGGEALVHAAMSRPTMEGKKKPRAKKAAFVAEV